MRITLGELRALVREAASNDRGKCQKCGKIVMLTDDGLVDQHDNCAGSGVKPMATAPMAEAFDVGRRFTLSNMAAGEFLDADDQDLAWRAQLAWGRQMPPRALDFDNSRLFYIRDGKWCIELGGDIFEYDDASDTWREPEYTFDQFIDDDD